MSIFNIVRGIIRRRTPTSSNQVRYLLYWMFSEMNQRELDRRRMLEENHMPVIEKLIHAGYRSLAQKTHPDAGGTDDEFKSVHAAYEQLKAAIKAIK